MTITASTTQVPDMGSFNDALDVTCRVTRRLYLLPEIATARWGEYACQVIMDAARFDWCAWVMHSVDPAGNDCCVVAGSCGETQPANGVSRHDIINQVSASTWLRTLALWYEERQRTPEALKWTMASGLVVDVLASRASLADAKSWVLGALIVPTRACPLGGLSGHVLGIACRLLLTKAVSAFAPVLSGKQWILSSREYDIATMLACGEHPQRIAAKLQLSPHTVHDHIKSIHRKVGVHNRGELAARVFGLLISRDE